MTTPLTACIQLNQEQLSPTQTLCHGVSFILDRQLLLDLLAAKSQGQNLVFVENFLLAWRRYALFCENNQLQHSWSFALEYEGSGVFKTLIALDGDVLQQVAAEILPHSSLYQQLSEVYYWLMQQLLAQLPWRTNSTWLQPLAWGMAIALVGITVIIHLGQFISQPLLILPALLCIWLLQWGIYRLLKGFLPRLRRLLLRQMMYGFFAKNYQIRELGLKLLARF